VTIQIQGARENNLQNVNVEIGDGLTVVTGVSGSGKTSLVFDTLYHESRRRFLEIYSLGQTGGRLAPARVKSITGLGPAVAVGQNQLNRNPNSTLATACGLHPFLRLLYARFGRRVCPHCGAEISQFSEDEIVDSLLSLASRHACVISAPLVQRVPGSHATLLGLLSTQFGKEALVVDSAAWDEIPLDPALPHEISIRITEIDGSSLPSTIRAAVQQTGAVGAFSLRASWEGGQAAYSRAPVCATCGTWIEELQPVAFHTPCPHCEGKGCARCAETGLHPSAAAVLWEGRRFPEVLAFSVDDFKTCLDRAQLPSTAARLHLEIERRVIALQRVGLGYIALERPSPTLSRGESQRVRLAVTLISRLEDMLHILDEPTVGLHPADVQRLLPAFHDLAGPVVFVEHDRLAVAEADFAIDLGPGAGSQGGQVIFSGTPRQLWQSGTVSGRYFSRQTGPNLPPIRPAPESFITLRQVRLRNLAGFDVSIPAGRLTVITGVSGSGKSTLVEDVLVASLAAGSPVGCLAV
jgi:excinuclease ABC subunit A